MKLPFLKNIAIKIILVFAIASITACKSKPSADKSVDYKNARSIPSLQVPAADEQATKPKRN